MTRDLVQFRVFIGSPGGLEDERRAFHKALAKFSECHAEPRGVVFKPVGWEDTLPGHGRPQALINQDLEPCDYAVFVFHDRWGSDAGSGGKVGTEEEFDLAEKLYAAHTLRNIVLLFKAVDARQMKDPGPQLQKVLDFKTKVETGKRYLFKPFDDGEGFRSVIEDCLARWLRDHENKGSLSADGATSVAMPAKAPVGAPPDWAYWIAEATRLEAEADPDRAAILYCRTQAVRTATSDAEWVEAENGRGVALAKVGRPSEALAAFQAVHDRAVASAELGLAGWSAKALRNKGVAFADLGRADEAITVYDDVLARFGAATELDIRESVAMALFNKGVALGSSGRSDEAIATYDEVANRFASETEPAIREQVAKALVNKGRALLTLGRNDEAIASPDHVVARFGAATETGIRRQVAMALANKGVVLGKCGRPDEAIATYDDVVARFAAAAEPVIREQVAMALVNKAITLRELGRPEEALAVLEDCIARYGGSSDPSTEKHIERARTLLARLRAKPKRKR